MIKIIKPITVACLLLITVTTFAHDDNKNASHNAENQHKSIQAILSIISGIKAGWENGDGTPFRNTFLNFKGARYIEGDGQNEGLDSLVEHHVEPEKGAMEYMKLDFNNVEVHLEGDNFAWAIADTHFQAKLKKSGRELDKSGYQTFLFRKINNQWKVVHTHSSSRNSRPKKDH